MGLTEKIANAGIVGAGGAGFPTYKKLVNGAEYLIINAVECEPLLSSDILVLSLFTEDIVKALDTVKSEMDIENVVIAIKAKHEQEIAKLKKTISLLSSSVKVFPIENVYPMGDEQVLIHEVTGRVVPPGAIPISVGTVVQNVSTVWNISNSLKDIPVTHKYICVLGEVNSPCYLKVPIGTSVKECINLAGGSLLDDYIYIMGGPMMGKFFKKESIQNKFITKTDGAIIILSKEHVLAKKFFTDTKVILNRAKSVCIQCSYCTEICPRYLLGHKIRPHRVMRSVAAGKASADLTDALLCCECGLCELYACPMGLSPRKVNIMIKQKLREAGCVSDKNIYTQQTASRKFRQVSQQRLISRLGLSKYSVTNLSLLSPDIKSVTIPLKQGIGTVSIPCIMQGEKVSQGQLIASPAPEKLGASIHSSIKGIAEEITSDYITIKACD